MENSDLPPLYNNRMIKVKIEYINKYYPNIDVRELLEFAGIKSYELEQRGHWLNQRQTDRFCNKLTEISGNADIIRDTGRHLALTSHISPIKQYLLGLLDLKAVYLRIDRVLRLFSRGATVTARSLGSHSVEIISKPEPGVEEKLYQCENRAGSFEAVGKLFTGSFAKVDHPECFHRGDTHCRYTIAWNQPLSLKWKRFSFTALILCIASAPFLFSQLPLSQAIPFLLSISIGALSLVITYFYKKCHEFSEALQVQGDMAKDEIDEANLRYNNIMAVHEIAKITSNILDADELIRAVMQAMQRRLDFDRGMGMLANENRTQLHFSAGYGYGDQLSKIFTEIEFNLTNPNSKGIFVQAFHRQEPFLIEDIDSIAQELSSKSHSFAIATGAKSLICVPIVFEKKSLGILVVDNVLSKRPLTQSDIGILSGIAAHAAANLSNAFSFKKLGESEKKYRDLIENANSVILRHDNMGQITFFNEFAQRLFNCDAEDIIGKKIVGTIFADTPETRKSMESMMATLRQNPNTRIVRETESILQGGETVCIAWTHRPILDSSGNISEILYIGNDITQLKQAQKEKKELELRLNRAQKMEALGTMAGGVAHDLNNILSGIMGYPELLLHQLPADSSMREPITKIFKSGERAAAVVQDLLTITRRGVMTSEVFNLNDIVLEYMVSPEHQNLLNYYPRVRFLTSLHSELPNISGSAIHLLKSLMNLTSNAAESIKDAGEVVIKTEHRYIDQPIRGYDKVNKGEYAILSLSDTGEGIDPIDLERIFEPFFTKKKMGRSGTGLGMALVWGTVKDHGGYIDVSSVQGQGTHFTLYFPVTHREPAQMISPIPIDSLKGNGERVLVIDDIQDQRDLASKLLTYLGYRVETATNGTEGLKMVAESPYDLIILDMIMGLEMDGLETYRQMLRIRPGQKAIIASGFSENDRVKEALRLGAGAYLKKPYSLESIGTAVQNEINRSSVHG